MYPASCCGHDSTATLEGADADTTSRGPPVPDMPDRNAFPDADGPGNALTLLRQCLSEQRQLKALSVIQSETTERQERLLAALCEEMTSTVLASAQRKQKDVDSFFCPAPCKEPRELPEIRVQAALSVVPADDFSDSFMPVASAIGNGLSLSVETEEGGQADAISEFEDDGAAGSSPLRRDSDLSEASDVRFEITGLGRSPISRKNLASSAREFAEGQNSCGKSVIELVAKGIERWHNIREPERTGFLASIDQSSKFGTLTMMVISFNAWLIAFTTDYEMEHPGQPLMNEVKLIDLALSCFYAFEILLKLAVHRLYFFCNEDMKWNVFDLMLVSSSILEIVVTFLVSESQGGINLAFLRLVRLCKIAKVLRVFRTLRFFTELRLMVDCVLGSFMNAIWCVAMLLFVMFIFSLLIVQSLAEYLSQNVDSNGELTIDAGNIRYYYGSVIRAILTLFQSTTAGLDWRDCFLPLTESSLLSAGVFLLFICLFTISVWNIVTSTFVEKALKLAQPDLDSLVFEQHMKDLNDSDMLLDLFGRARRKHPTSIDYEEFRAIAENSQFRSYMSARGIDIKNVDIFFQMLVSSSGGEEVDLKVLADSCVRMKGFATSIDLQSLSFETKLISRKQAKSFKDMSRHVRRLEDLVQSVSDNFAKGHQGVAPRNNRASVSSVKKDRFSKQSATLSSSDLSNLANSLPATSHTL